MLYEILHPIRSLREGPPPKKGWLFSRLGGQQPAQERRLHTWADVARLGTILAAIMIISAVLPSRDGEKVEKVEEKETAVVNADVKQLSESYEDYIEAVLILMRRKGFARSVDVAEYLHVRAQSVSTALKALNSQGHLVFAADGHISLTESGADLAKTVYHRHVVMAALLEKTGIPAAVAWQDGGQMAHKMSESTVKSVEEFVGDVPDKMLDIDVTPASSDVKQ